MFSTGDGLTLGFGLAAIISAAWTIWIMKRQYSNSPSMSYFKFQTMGSLAYGTVFPFLLLVHGLPDISLQVNPKYTPAKSLFLAKINANGCMVAPDVELGLLNNPTNSSSAIEDDYVDHQEGERAERNMNSLHHVIGDILEVSSRHLRAHN